MTDTKNQQNTGAPQQGKESGVSKILGGFSWWISSLMGKPRARPQAQAPQTQTQPVQPAPTVAPPLAKTEPKQEEGTKEAKPVKTEDPVFQDLQKFKSVLGKFTG